MGKSWPALVLRASVVDDSDDIVSAVLTDFSPVAIHDLAERPLPPGGLWDPTYPPIPDPPPTPLHWNVCFNDAGERDRAAEAIREAVPAMSIEPVDLPDEDWAARSQQSLTAVHAGAFIVAPPWDIPADPGDATVIVIEPSMGFGTGHHATTRMCLRLLSEIDVADATVIDLGTGSGVLAMAAALRGARRVDAIDIDQDAIDSAESSARLNTLPDTIAFHVSDFRQSPPPAADLVLANLTGGMLTSSAASIAALVRPHGQVILSGFDHTEVDRVLAAFASFTERQRLSEDSWIALHMQR
ncbi:MAG TPA: 50S ribosomal protein L11 methyltransferase [Vicinamibacterales bacterium]